ncbi:hypothetical protein F5B20DRAFT_235096 [Whalleya microplaca]|nr:hypothetical protein F5B20DRAFT_235096 [Whalleya microplaca]
MSDLPQPSVAKKKLPFKRTARRKSSETADPDGLSLFSRSHEFFPSVIEDQQRQAREKAAAAERERKEKLAREHREEQDALKEQLAHDQESAKKRRRVSVPDNEDNSDDDVFGSKPRKLQKSPATPLTPSSKRRESSFLACARASESAQGSRSRSRKTDTPIINLDDSDSNEDPKIAKSKPRASIPQQGSEIVLDDDKDDEDDDDIKLLDTGLQPTEQEEDPHEHYVKAALERMAKAKALREARERGESLADDDDPVVQILIWSQISALHTITIRRKLSQSLTLVYDAWVEHQVRKGCAPVTREQLADMFFTWKGNKVYRHTTLATLGIRPDREGRLYPSWMVGSGRDADTNGYHDQHKVLFEACTPEIFEDNLRERERRRLWELGELVEDDDGNAGDGAGQQEESREEEEDDKKVRVHFKARDLATLSATVRLSTTAAMLVKVYRRLAKLPEDKHFELHWDGEVLDPETTVEEAEIEDMDSLEVHFS